MSDDWEARIEQFWDTADLEDREGALEQMRLLVAERPDDDAVAVFEWACIHDSLGIEGAAVPLYRRALDLGLDDFNATRATIQLASSLRNVGEVDEAVALLQAAPDAPALGAARQVFLALALHSAGRPDEALREALLAIVPTLPRYQRSARAYADALVEPARTA